MRPLKATKADRAAPHMYGECIAYSPADGRFDGGETNNRDMAARQAQAWLWSIVVKRRLQA